MSYKADDIELLLPTFRRKVRELLLAMGELGYEPVLRDSLRTAAEAAKNAQAGKGTVDSMHLYGVAADIICNKHGWDCHRAKPPCKFFNDLGREAEALGLTWGRHFKRSDDCHVQAVPVRLQDKIRAARDESARDAICAKHLGV